MQANKKKSKKAKAGNANNAKYVLFQSSMASRMLRSIARSICKHEWIKNNHGTEEEWAAYWDSLDAETLQVLYPM